MEEQRFDDLTRTLGRATSRRQVLKGLLGGLGVALLGRNSTPVAARGGTCSSQQFQTCTAAAKAEFDILAANCKTTTEGPIWLAQFCEFGANVKYTRALLKCQMAQCAEGESCVDNRCCRGDNCCQEEQIHCPDPRVGAAGGTCCPAGSTCCAGGCCPPENTCCVKYGGGYSEPPVTRTCTNLQTDPNNCGACNNECDGLPCIDGTCQCPPGEGLCAGPFNQTCCKPNERCQATLSGFVSCVPICTECEEYDPNDTIEPCKPKECPACQECDLEDGQCIPAADGTECGSGGLLCCGGQCVDTTCSGQQTFNVDTCQCECPQITCPGGQSPDPNTCECDCSPPPGGCPAPNLWSQEDCQCLHPCNFDQWGCGG